MEAIILAAGKGTRLLPLTQDIPKAMVFVNGKPMLQIIIEQLRSIGITQLIIVVHYHKEKIRNYFEDGSRLGVNITYVEQKQMAGSADAVLCAEKHVRGNSFLVIACDSLFETGLLSRLLQHKSDGVFTCKPVEDGRRYGILLLDGKKVARIVEKPEHPPSNLANFSVYLLPRSIFHACKQVKKSINNEYWITEAIQLLIDQGKIFEYEISKEIIDIGTHEQLAEAQKLARRLGL